MNAISNITRRNIFDFIRIEGIWYSGRLEEHNFLSRIFDLDELPSDDNRFSNMSGDLWQHRVNNPNDWPEDWVFSDIRLNLLNCDDSNFLQFLSEMMHPIVRADSTEVHKLLQIFNDNLQNDGFEIVEKAKISNKPIFSGRKIVAGFSSIEANNNVLFQKLIADYVSQQITLMESAIDNAPHVAIGIAKELIETCCIKIVEERDVVPEKSWDLLQLLKNTNRELKLSPADIPDEKKASKTIKTILSSLGAVVHGICELRNDYGSGHGKNSNFTGLNKRHARLAVGAATTLSIFLLETHEIV
ncbi:abortive infection family protein [Pedobacter sp. MR22-3]|uniref:abortive infection family protein n=1 Tax=Pedobacter sp. MR22-3 TaxID=2994552 RepID=UPI002247452E|nr:abortive infection family protein [Pedobacter sp. MR22-3]MCX2584277.1 abortive infection family protein [Pedobacter sp. MR22-3]